MFHCILPESSLPTYQGIGHTEDHHWQEVVTLETNHGCQELELPGCLEISEIMTKWKDVDFLDNCVCFL